MQGWISVYREILDKPIWTTSTPEQKVVLMTIMLMVNHEDNEWEFKGEKFTVKSGQMITSLESIVQKCGKGISIQNVRTSLKRFEKYGFLTNESTNKNRLITIVNYGFYQAKDENLTSKVTSSQQATNKQLTTNNNDNNNNNENKEEYILVFNHWNEQKIKVHRKANQKMIGHINARLKEYSQEELIQAINNYKDVLESEKHYFSYKWTLEDFMTPNRLINFLDENSPLENYLKNEFKIAPGQTNIFDFDLEEKK